MDSLPLPEQAEPASRYRDFPVLDTARLDELRRIEIPGEPSVLLTLLGIFFREAPPLFCNLLDAMDRGDCALLQRHAHKLAGSCGNFGGVEMTRLCRDLEQDGEPFDLDTARQFRPWLQKAFPALCEVLQRELDQPGLGLGNP